jgi:hypothetical protein
MLVTSQHLLSLCPLSLSLSLSVLFCILFVWIMVAVSIQLLKWRKVKYFSDFCLSSMQFWLGPYEEIETSLYQKKLGG